MDFNHYDIANFELDDAESPNLASLKVSKHFKTQFGSFLSQKANLFQSKKCRARKSSAMRSRS